MVDMKKCRTCNIEKPLDDYSKRLEGKQQECRPCNSNRKKEWYRKNKEYANQYSRDKYASNAEAHREYARKWRLANRERYLANDKAWKTRNKDKLKEAGRVRALKRYGLTPEAYEAILIKQDNKCAICQLDAKTKAKRLHVDHSHETGIVRGLLCSNCNTLLGLAKEAPSVLEASISYLRKF